MADDSVVFTPRYMLKVLNDPDYERPVQYFLSKWFTDYPPVPSEIVDLDKYRGKRSISPYVNPMDDATRAALAEYTTSTVKLPYLCEQVTVSAKDLQVRPMGGTVYDSQGSYGQRAEQVVGEALKQLDIKFATTDEVAAAKALQTGKIPIVGPNVRAEVDLRMPADNIVTNLSGASLWNDPVNSDPIGNLRAWKRIPARNGGRMPINCVMGWKASDDFLKNNNVHKQLETRRVERGYIKPEDLPDGVEFLGVVENLYVYVYSATYVDLDGNDQFFMHPNKVLLGPNKTRAIRLFGPIYNLHEMALEPRFPSSRVSENGKFRIVQLESMSLPVPFDIEDFVCAEVTEE